MQLFSPARGYYFINCSATQEMVFGQDNLFALSNMKCTRITIIGESGMYGAGIQ